MRRTHDDLLVDRTGRRHLVRALDALPTGGRGTFGARRGCLPVVCRAGAAAGDLADHHDATSRVMAQFRS